MDSVFDFLNLTIFEIQQKIFYYFCELVLEDWEDKCSPVPFPLLLSPTPEQTVPVILEHTSQTETQSDFLSSVKSSVLSGSEDKLGETALVLLVLDFFQLKLRLVGDLLVIYTLSKLLETV